MAKEPGSVGGIAVAMPTGPRFHVGVVRAARTQDTIDVGSGPLTVHPESDPHDATEA